jgi:rhodanese-related sulfurtransferase
MRVLLLIVFTLAYMIGITACQAQSKKITNEELTALIKDGQVQLVDVRTPEETADGMIEGAQNINFRDASFREQIGSLDKDKPVAVYCGAGGRSGKTSQLLEELGFKEIYDLSGGFTQWEAEEYPVFVPEIE